MNKNLIEKIAEFAPAYLKKVAYVGTNTASVQNKKHPIGTQVGSITVPRSGGIKGGARGFKPGEKAEGSNNLPTSLPKSSAG